MKNAHGTLFILFLSFLSLNAQWVPQHTFDDNDLLLGDIFFLDQNHIWCYDWNLSNEKRYIWTNNGGNDWHLDTLKLGANESITYIHPRNDSTIYVSAYEPSVNMSGSIYKTTNGEKSWAKQASAFTTPMSWPQFVYFYNDSIVVTLGYPKGGYFEIYTTVNGGSNWNKISNDKIPPFENNEYNMNGVYCFYNDIIWVPIFKYNEDLIRVFISKDRGNNWLVNQFHCGDPTLWPSSIAFQNENEGLLVLSSIGYSEWATSNSKIFTTKDGGLTWQNSKFSNLSIDAASVCCIPETPNGYLVTAPLNNIGTAYTIDAGNTWQLVDDSVDLFIPRFYSQTDGWATGWSKGNVIYKWTGNLVSVKDENLSISNAYKLEQNYPNSFNPTTKIKYTIPLDEKRQMTN